MPNAVYSFPTTFDCHTNGELLGGGEILLKTGTSKSYLSKAFHRQACTPPPFFSNFRNAIPLFFKIQGHIFEVCILASEIQDKMDFTFGVKNMFELEGIIDSRTCSVNFLNRSLPIFPVAHHKIKLGKMAYVKVRILFVEKIFWYYRC